MCAGVFNSNFAEEKYFCYEPDFFGRHSCVVPMYRDTAYQ